MVGRGGAAWVVLSEDQNCCRRSDDWAMQSDKVKPKHRLRDKHTAAAFGRLLLVPVKKGWGGREGRDVSLVGFRPGNGHVPPAPALLKAEERRKRGCSRAGTASACDLAAMPGPSWPP